MSTSKQTTHTPGPWKTRHTNGVIELHAPTRDELAYVPVSLTTGGDGDQQDQANARLIAAAPELLAALDQLQSSPNDPRAHRAAFEAMRKARGGAV